MSNKQAIEIIKKMINKIQCFDSSNDDIIQLEYERGLHDGEYQTLENVLDIIQSLPDTDEWISVEENEPNPGVQVLISFHGQIKVAHMSTSTGYFYSGGSMLTYTPTHWMELPKLPTM